MLIVHIAISVIMIYLICTIIHTIYNVITEAVFEKMAERITFTIDLDDAS